MTYQASRLQQSNGNNISRLKRRATTCKALFIVGVVCISLILFSGCASQTESPSKVPLSFEAAQANMMDWPNRTIENSIETFLRTDNVRILFLAGGASIVMHKGSADRDIAEHFEKHGMFDGFGSESLNVIGHPAMHLAATGIYYFVSAQNEDELHASRAWTMMTALSLTNLTTLGLKAIRDNEAPNDEDWAWPSGHASSSFTVASMLDEFYGPRVGIPAYAMASLVAYRMMDTGDHWASDVVFGASLGWVVGHTFAGKHKQLEVAGFKVLPYTGNTNSQAVGITLMRRF